MPARAGAEAACPLAVCDGSGWILGPEDVARPCECRGRSINRARLRGVASVIPPKYRGVSFDRPPVTEIQPDAVAVVREFCADLQVRLAQGRGLWLYGDPATGKTTLAMLVSRITLERGRSVAIYSMPKLLTRIRRTYDDGPGEQTYAELFERLATVDLLHLDDLGVENRTEWVLEQLYALINERYEAERSLVVTSNHDYDDLEQILGSRITSRLGDMCELIPLHGTDRRVVLRPVADEPEDAHPGPRAQGEPGGGPLGSLD
jgi:DNA replication protein DnaC